VASSWSFILQCSLLLTHTVTYADICGCLLLCPNKYGCVFLLLQGAEEDAGRIGLTIVLAGVIGSFVGGVMLDKTHWFK